MTKKYAFAAFALVIFAVSCAKIPEKVQSPSLKIDIENKDGGEVYTVQFSGGITNENSSVALGAVKGTISIRDPKSKETIFTFPFQVEMILPFSMGIIDAVKTCPKKDVDPLIALFSINEAEMIKNKGSEGIFVEEDQVALSIDSYQKHDISTLLQGKINEKK